MCGLMGNRNVSLKMGSERGVGWRDNRSQRMNGKRKRGRDERDADDGIPMGCRCCT